MSSRWIPPKVGAIRTTVSTNVSTSVGVDQDRHRRDPGELVVEHGLALHHRHRRDRADVAEPEHPRAVRADRDASRRSSCTAPRARARPRSPCTRARRPGCTRRASPARFAPASGRRSGACRPSWRSRARSSCHRTLHVVERADQLGDPIGLGDVPDLDGDVPDRVLTAERDRDHVADQPARRRRSPEPPARAGRRGAGSGADRCSRACSSLEAEFPDRGVYHPADRFDSVTPAPSVRPGPGAPAAPPRAGSDPCGELLASLNLAARAPVHRPYTIVNFVASADGRATVRGTLRRA